MILKEIPLDQINPGERYREDFGDIEDLARDISKNGLIHPIAIWSATGEPPYLLAAGERRLRAHVALGLDKIACRIYDHLLNDLELRSIELSENIHRKDLGYMEKANLCKEINRLQVEIYGEKVSTSSEATGWSQKDTAELLGRATGTVSQDIKLAMMHENYPELGLDKCKDKAEALKLVRKMEEEVIREELAKRTESQANASQDKLIKSYLVGDFFELVKKMPEKSFHLVEIDPPYGINLGKMKQKDGVSRYNYKSEDGTGYNEIDAGDYVNFLQNTLNECYRVMAEHSWLILWFAPEPWFEVCYDCLIGSNFNVSRMCGIWVKPSGQSMNPNSRLASAYEMFFWARKGDPALARPGALNVFKYTQVPAQQKTHPTERPLALMKDIVTTFAFEGSRVLVPFAGSGVTLQAAYESSMLPVGCDLHKGYKNSFIIRATRSRQ